MQLALLVGISLSFCFYLKKEKLHRFVHHKEGEKRSLLQTAFYRGKQHFAFRFVFFFFSKKSL